MLNSMITWRQSALIWRHLVWPLYPILILIDFVSIFASSQLRASGSPLLFLTILYYVSVILVPTIGIRSTFDRGFAYFYLFISSHPESRVATWATAICLWLSIVWRGALFQVPLMVIIYPFFSGTLPCLSANLDHKSIDAFYCYIQFSIAKHSTDGLFMLFGRDAIVTFLLLLGWLPAVKLATSRWLKARRLSITTAPTSNSPK